MKLPKDTELEQLENGLRAAAPLSELISTVANKDAPAELYSKGAYYVKWAGYMMAIAGVYFLALKEKLDHGEFKKFFIGKDRPVSYTHAWECMKAAHVVAEHSVFGELRSSRAFHRLLLLPAPEQAAIANEIKDVPWEQVSELLPDKIQKRYDEIKNQRRQEKSAKETERRVAIKNEKPPAPSIQQALEESREKEWMNWVTDYTKLKIQLERLSRREIKPEWYDRIFDREMLKPLSAAFNGVVERMYPVDEVRKRAKIVHAPGFTR